MTNEKIERELIVAFVDKLLAHPEVVRVNINIDFRDDSSISVNKHSYNKK